MASVQKLLTVALVAVVAAMTVVPAYAASESGNIYRPPVRIKPSDIPTLQRGYSVFMQNCLSCHSLGLLRYNRVAEDLGWDEDYMRHNGLMPEQSKLVDYIRTALEPEGAEAVYGVVPPDLSLKARERGSDWLHAFLTGYYQDAEASTGFNNAVMANTVMPNILAGKQGIQTPVYEEDHGRKVLVGLEIASEGSLNSKQFYEEVRDLVSFLRYASEPAIIQRHAMGIWVIGFLLILLLLTWLLKRDYWRDIK